MRFCDVGMWAVLGVLLLALGGCAGRQPDHEDITPRPGAFFLPDGTPVAAVSLPEYTRDAAYVLVGETHDSAVDHQAQAVVMTAMAGAGQRPAVGLEMLPHDRYSRELNAFVSGTMGFDDLPAALEWQRSWGYDIALYKPVFETAAAHGLPLYGVNIENDLRRAVSRKGLEGLDRKERAALPSRIIPPTAEQRKILAEFFTSHSGMLRGRGAEPVPASRENSSRRIIPAAMQTVYPPGPPKAMAIPAPLENRMAVSGSQALERFLLIQSLWDSTMAEQAHRIRTQSGLPVVVLAGGGHVGHGYGIAHRLRIVDPGARIVSIMPFSGNKPEPDEADIFFYSPPRPRGYGIRFGEGTGTPVITAVEKGSRAEKAGLRAGDAVFSAGNETVRTPSDLHKAALTARQAGKPLVLGVRRGSGDMAVTIY